MGNKSSIFSRIRSNKNDNTANTDDHVVDTLNNKGRQQLHEIAPDLVPHYDAINTIIYSEDDFYIPSRATKLDDCLYLGSIEDAKNITKLKEHGVTYIINTAESPYEVDEAQRKCLYDETFRYMGFDAEDAMDYPIMKHFEEVHAFIEEARKNNSKCLLHCMRGVNRSGVLATAHVMVRNNIGPISATQIVYKKRGMLLTNSSFVSQLLIYAKDNGYLELDKDHVILNKNEK